MTSKPPVLVLPRPIPNSLSALMAREDFLFVDRAKAESDESTRQIIPYILIARGGRLLGYRRSMATGETRLADSLSLGWGGHIEQIDGLGLEEPRMQDFIENCATREIYEELGLDRPNAKTELGLINDESTEVGRVHLALVAVWEYRDIPDSAEESTASDIFWVDPSDKRLSLEEYESWSRIAVNLYNASRKL